ncbi:translation initiation factor IF-2-like [Mustela erminea]|uniref:translation initiation factor IF-2-like n=1 Tax=Mustela erminea TaxID=36723 RepID=UPI0013866A16|nr:translation initiation factor IF-2-like [Mustela erminea]
MVVGGFLPKSGYSLLSDTASSSSHGIKARQHRVGTRAGERPRRPTAGALLTLLSSFPGKAPRGLESPRMAHAALEPQGGREATLCPGSAAGARAHQLGAQPGQGGPDVLGARRVPRRLGLRLRPRLRSRAPGAPARHGPRPGARLPSPEVFQPRAGGVGLLLAVHALAAPGGAARGTGGGGPRPVTAWDPRGSGGRCPSAAVGVLGAHLGDAGSHSRHQQPKERAPLTPRKDLPRITFLAPWSAPKEDLCLSRWEPEFQRRRTGAKIARATESALRYGSEIKLHEAHPVGWLMILNCQWSSGTHLIISVPSHLLSVFGDLHDGLTPSSIVILDSLHQEMETYRHSSAFH